jgi:cellulose synthase/poly-beta-1,6-N-acetylglucosamine synthase-like glycosyltransferase
VLRFSVDRMMALEYPPDRLRVVIVDDGSHDGTPELLEEKFTQHYGRVVVLRRENGGQGKSHTLNYGLDRILGGAWAEAVLITDADVVFEPTAIRRMVRHLADPTVGAVTAFIREASQPANWLNRYIGYEYATAQAAARRAQNVFGAHACLAGGAQLHSRSNLEALGGRIDTSTLAEDTVTTFATQLDGRRVIFDGNAVCLAEEPADITGLWKQRLRWARGNLQVTSRYRHVFFRSSPTHRLGGVWFGLNWFATLLLPAFMIFSSAALMWLWLIQDNSAAVLFQALWIINALGFIFTTLTTLLLDRTVLRRSWFQALTFPGLISLVIMASVLVPRPMSDLASGVSGDLGVGWSADTRRYLMLAAYAWVGASMSAAWLIYRLDQSGRARFLLAPLMLVVGYGPMLCAINVAAYVAQARGAAATWDKTIKTGKVGAR